jgi:hypothetical protein
MLRHATAAYLTPIVLLTILLEAFLLNALHFAGANWIILLIAGIIAVIPASELGVTLINWDLTHFFSPRLLPRITTVQGVPEDASTFVVVPTIFFSESQVQELIERLEVHFLANQDPRIYFAQKKCQMIPCFSLSLKAV